jgi:hypothetical protein
MQRFHRDIQRDVQGRLPPHALAPVDVSLELRGRPSHTHRFVQEEMIHG